MRSAETVARLGGDEFGFLLTGVDRRETAALLERVQGVLSNPFTVHGMPLEIEASIGIAFYPEHGADVDELLQHADVAMYVAKRTGARSAVYDAGEDSNTPTRLTIGGELRRALEQRELALFYQPQVELATGAVTGVEAMLGWQHPTHGLLAPEALRPIAERAGLIDGLTRYVVEGALRQRAQWQREGYQWPVAVNVSTRSLDREQFAVDLEELLSRWNVPASALKLELSELAAGTDPGRAAEALEALRRHGVRVTLDHLGGGQASIASLRLLPLDEIKLDASLVAGVESSPGDLAIVASAIDLARRLGLEVVADGIDTPELSTVLGDLGCHSGQGRHWTAPLPPDVLTAWLANRRARERHRASSRLSWKRPHARAWRACWVGGRFGMSRWTSRTPRTCWWWPTVRPPRRRCSTPFARGSSATTPPTSICSCPSRPVVRPSSTGRCR